jgi:hypothetical protein
MFDMRKTKFFRLLVFFTSLLLGITTFMWGVLFSLVGYTAVSVVLFVSALALLVFSLHSYPFRKGGELCSMF